MAKTFINLHQHTHYSNGTTIPEVVSKPSDYIQYALDNGLKSVCFTEHGNVFSWVAKKKLANASGLKYIHGVEAYVTETLDEKVADNYHLVLIARNHEGVLELNRLISHAYGGRNGEEGNNHFYFKPRLSASEVANTSDNIFILSACLGGPLWQNYSANNMDNYNRWVDFFKKNKHRAWLEVQPHNDREQIQYNKLLLSLHEEHGIPLVATNDVHAVDKRADELRKSLMRGSKFFEPKAIKMAKESGISLAEAEDIIVEEWELANQSFECWAKSYNEMLESFEAQGVLSKEQAIEALANTLVIDSMIEDHEFDRTFKYPKISDTPEDDMKKIINTGYRSRGLNKMPKDQLKEYIERVQKEYKVYKDMGAIDYMLLEEYVVGTAKRNGKWVGPARGSVSGSLIAYLMGVTDVDPIKENLSFERFMNKDRISLPDVDNDISGVGEESDRAWVEKFMMNNEKFNCSAIVTYGTLAIKSAIKVAGRSLNMQPQLLNEITSDITDDGDIPVSIRNDYSELIEIAEGLVGTVTHVGRHASGFVVTTDDIESVFGEIQVAKYQYPVTAIAMKEIDYLNYVKLDILGLDNVFLIGKTCEFANLPYLTPERSDIIDFHDQEVMEDLRKSTVGIFQFGAPRAFSLVKDMFAPEVQERMKSSGVNTDPVNQLALLSAAMRPGSVSIIEDIVAGKVFDNGHPALNKLLEQTLGYLIYQESIIEWLVTFCGRTPSEADTIRRAIGKKDADVMNHEMPIIKQQFVNTMVKEHGDTREHAEELVEKFIQILNDATNYSFSRNHAIPYSYIGYISAWVRYYYPLEFLTAGMIVANTKGNEVAQARNKEYREYAEMRGISLHPHKFRRSKGDYFFDKETNGIYEGTKSIKSVNESIGDMLYDSFANKQYDDFVDFLLDLKEPIKNVTLIDEDGMKLTYSTRAILNMSEEEVKELDKKIKSLTKISEDNVVYTSVNTPVNKTQMENLISVNYFEEFGGNLKLAEIFNKFNSTYKPNNKTWAGKRKHFQSVKELFKKTPDKSYPLTDQLGLELELIGKCSTTSDKVSDKFCFVTNVERNKSYANVTLYSVKKGKELTVKVGITQFNRLEIKVKDLIELKEHTVKPKPTRIDGVWTQHPTEKVVWLKQYVIVRRDK